MSYNIKFNGIDISDNVIDINGIELRYDEYNHYIIQNVTMNSLISLAIGGIVKVYNGNMSIWFYYVENCQYDREKLLYNITLRDFVNDVNDFKFDFTSVVNGYQLDEYDYIASATDIPFVDIDDPKTGWVRVIPWLRYHLAKIVDRNNIVIGNVIVDSSVSNKVLNLSAVYHVKTNDEYKLNRINKNTYPFNESCMQPTQHKDGVIDIQDNLLFLNSVLSFYKLRFKWYNDKIYITNSTSNVLSTIDTDDMLAFEEEDLYLSRPSKILVNHNDIQYSYPKDFTSIPKIDATDITDNCLFIPSWFYNSYNVDSYYDKDSYPNKLMIATPGSLGHPDGEILQPFYDTDDAFVDGKVVHSLDNNTDVLRGIFDLYEDQLLKKWTCVKVDNEVEEAAYGGLRYRRIITNPTDCIISRRLSTNNTDQNWNPIVGLSRYYGASQLTPSYGLLSPNFYYHEPIRYIIDEKIKLLNPVVINDTLRSDRVQRIYNETSLAVPISWSNMNEPATNDYIDDIVIEDMNGNVSKDGSFDLQMIEDIIETPKSDVITATNRIIYRWTFPTIPSVNGRSVFWQIDYWYDDDWFINEIGDRVPANVYYEDYGTAWKKHYGQFNYRLAYTYQNDINGLPYYVTDTQRYNYKHYRYLYDNRNVWVDYLTSSEVSDWNQYTFKTINRYLKEHETMDDVDYGFKRIIMSAIHLAEDDLEDYNLDALGSGIEFIQCSVKVDKAYENSKSINLSNIEPYKYTNYFEPLTTKMVCNWKYLWAQQTYDYYTNINNPFRQTIEVPIYNWTNSSADPSVMTLNLTDLTTTLEEIN